MARDNQTASTSTSTSNGDGNGGRAGDDTVRLAQRFDQFSRLADQVADGEFVMLPRRLRGDDRRRHVRQTIREDHQHRIADGMDGTDAKFDKLAGSLFSFFRGTALLFYRDMVGEDAWMPTVLALGDVHPANFGVMPNSHGEPVFGVNDFDEAFYAPFTWDVKRGAVGFLVAAAVEGGHGAKKQRAFARRFVRGYLDGIEGFARDDSELDHELRLDNAPKMIRRLIEEARTSRADWLRNDYLDEYGRGFRSTDELVPISADRDRFQEIIEQLDDGERKIPPRAGELRVKDVAKRRGQGTASLGLTRYYLLIEGPRADASDDLIIEMKQARRSALDGLVPPTDFEFDDPGHRVTHAQAVQLLRGDVFYGHVEIDGSSFLTRERSPFKDDIDLDDLSKKGWKRYASICGEALAHAHALSDELGSLEVDVESQILAATRPRDLFVDDVLRFAEETFDRLRADHEAFIADHELGAYTTVDRDYG